jgi:hypothetical protein
MQPAPTKRVSFDMTRHSIPQPPMLAGSLVLTEEESELVDSRGPVVQFSTSIWWAYFVLGAAMLLGFNGNISRATLTRAL